jgi:methylmalonyl-CoA mutase N-terminal domain/subunit
MDEALSLPTEKAVQVALRTQQILACESGAADTVDPLAGSYAVEALTDEIERRAEAYISKIDSLGGAIAAIERGFPQAEIHEAAYRTQQAVENGGQIVVGVNQYQSGEPPELETLRVDPAIAQRQLDRLRALKGRRDGARAATLLRSLETAAGGSGNLMPIILECVENDLTLGEICGALRAAWGEYHPEG